ncbi:AI-2E family transporter [bacterium]|uniref:AI-2E family transporter n=1 Tax=Lachnospiraceae TaxID=186803 RepID=UPI002A2951E4|nr:AI-2E family transporter [bacterium]MDD6514787.1 AI-2E family transporter [bacterium]MDY4504150.1 AI-2E family transporter [Bariatricus sp.]
MENDEKLQERKSDDPASAPYYVKRPQFGKEGPSKLRQEFSRGMTMFLVIMACVVLYFALLRLDSITNAVSMVIDVLKPILYGMVIAYLLNPIVKQVDRILVPRLEKYMQKNRAKKCSRGIGVILSLVFLFALITALCNMLIPELVKSIRDLIITLPGQLNNVVDWFNHLQASDTAMGILMRNALEEGTTTLQNWLRTDLMPQVNTIMSNLTVGVLNILNEVLNFLIGLIVSVYLLFSKEQYSAQCKKMTYAFLKTNHANMLLHLTKKSNEIFGGFIIGKIIDSAIIGVLCFIGLSLIKMPYTLLVSVIVGVTNVIPFFGPYIGAIPSAFLILLSDPKKGLYFIIFILVLQQIDGNVIGPKILGNSTGLSPFWVVFSILIGGGMFGFVGMIMGVPTFAVIYYIISMITSQRLERKNLPLTTVHYGVKSYVNEKGEFISDDITIVDEDEKNNE